MIKSIRLGIPRRRMLGLILLFVLLGAVAGGLVALARRPGYMALNIGDTRYRVRVVSTDADREKGLSGTAALQKDEGMLFVYDEDNRWGIWMKEMNYSIDILWLDESKTVVDLVENASPASYPTTIYRSEKPGRYVLELPAGSVEDAAIATGSRAVFDVKTMGGIRS